MSDLSDLNMDYINSLIIQSSTSSNNIPIKYINCIPKIQYHEYTQINMPNNFIMLIDNDDNDDKLNEIQKMNPQYLQKQYKLFYVSEPLLNNIINDIIQTTGKYVYPMIFVNYLKQTLKINEKVNFDNSLLLYLRIWSNQIRELASSSTISNNDIQDKIKYIGYKICCELLYYYKYVHQ